MTTLIKVVFLLTMTAVAGLSFGYLCGPIFGGAVAGNVAWTWFRTLFTDERDE